MSRVVGPTARIEALSQGAEPHRVRLSRAKGWRIPPNTVKVDRSTRWGNPFSGDVLKSAGGCGCRNCQVVAFESELSEAGKQSIRENLAGKNLACWCPLDRKCHADILLYIANGWPEPRMPDA